MQKSRRWRGLEFHLLPLTGLLQLSACASASSRAGTVPSAAPSAQAAVTTPPSVELTPAAASETQPQPAADAQRQVVPPAPATPALPLPKGTLVLQIGDSFADALGPKLAVLLHAQGVRSDVEAETPSYIPNWSYGSALPKFVSRYQPDLVLITLGANELEIPHPEERAKPIRHLVSVLGGRPCAWIAPPLWKPDSGVLKVIRDNIAPCRYVDSNVLVHDLPRAHDKIHPNTEGREIWAKAVFDWLVKERVGTPEKPWALRPEPTDAAPSH